MNNRENALLQDVKLQLTNGYAPRFDQISRLLNYLAGRGGQARVLQEQIGVDLGWSVRQVENLASLATAMGLVRPVTYRLAPLGAQVVRGDPFLEDLGTLWVCHFQLASQERYVVWNRMANVILPAANQPLTAVASVALFDDLKQRFSERSVARHVLKELRAFFQAYTGYRLSRLSYLAEVSGGYALCDRPAPVPEFVFLALMLWYRDRFSPTATGAEIPDLCHASNSPGRLLHLPEQRVRETLEALNRRGLLSIESRANLDQVRFRTDLTALDALAQYYQET